MNTTFDSPKRLTKYQDGSYRFVSNEKIKIGDQVNVGFEKPQIVTVDEILEERKSMGTFKNHVPFSYKLRVR